MSYCSPKRNRIKKYKDTCLDNEIVDEMVDLFNKSSHHQKIDKSLSISKKIKLLEDGLKAEIPCSDEYCLQYSSTFKPIQKKLQRYYRPSVPKDWKINKKTWLNTLNIEDNLNQYNEAYPDFQFLTVSPIDFDAPANYDICVNRNLCTIDLEKFVSKGKKRLGAVFNLDKHNQSGSHWTSMFIDLNLGEAYYFDSVANFLPNEIVNLMTRISEQGNDLVYKNKIQLNNLEKRMKTQVINGNAQISMTDLCNHLIKDYNFINYRFGYVFNDIPKTKFNIKPTDDLVKAIIGQVLYLIDLTKEETYVNIPDFEKIIEETDKLFINEWVQSNVSIALSNLFNSIHVLVGNNTNYKVKDWTLDESNIILKLDEIPNESSLTDGSIKCFKNYIQHQFKNTECGMYSINFIDSFLTSDQSFNSIILNPLSDDILNNLRYTKYFTPE